MTLGDVRKVMRMHDTDTDKVIAESMGSCRRRGEPVDDAIWHTWQELVFGWDMPRSAANRLIADWLKDNVYEEVEHEG